MSKILEQYKKTDDVGFTTKRRKFQDIETGEIIELDETYKMAFGIKQFWKIYLADFLSILGLVADNQQINVLIYILENVNQTNNIFIGTYEKISENTGISRSTVARIIKKLKNVKYKNDVMMRKIQNGVWMVSPHLLIKGGENKRKSLMITWQEVASSQNIQEKKKTS